MELLPLYQDGLFDLAIVDPPYGDSLETGSGQEVVKDGQEERVFKGRNHTRFGGQFDKYRITRTGGTWQTKYKGKIKSWDVAPRPDYFKELFRVSKKVIIWGGNYFGLPANRNFIVWRKLTISESFSMAMVEYAWTNIWGNAKWFECAPQDKNRFHPTQKPAALYRWLLKNYAQRGWQILDTHLGSGTHALACIDMGFDLTACEIDEFYCSESIKMIRNHLTQGTIPFDEAPGDYNGSLFD